MHADIRRQYLFLARPVFALASFAAAGLSKEKLHALDKRGKQFYFFYNLFSSYNTRKYHTNIIGSEIFNREAIEVFLPASLSRASEAKSRESAGKKVCGRPRGSAVNKNIQKILPAAPKLKRRLVNPV